ncbi:Dynactin subunit 4 [Acipenser ruthenus]|uniref:Dynactin subunit 4 n=1 Tax=Acipenser ruthenus TaxID=7906 RepID=A0A444UZC9_ACIRT|nr:Dynactin subunit 4 [Acipenser ruthenus]
MASLLQADRVLYLVSGEKKIRSPLSQLYYCRYCSELRSLECVSHEVDSHYCPSCLENMPSAEAKLKKNRCANCFDCPCCMHTLSTRATNIPSPLPDDPAKTTMKKAYYLACGFCRWTSRDVGMADKSVASGGWQEPENPHTQRINKLIEYYQQLAQREKVERDRKKLARRRTYMPLAYSVAVSPKELLLAGKDAAAEYDELAEPQDFQDDPDVVAFRKSNKIGIFIKVTPQCEEGEVTLSFKMRHDFRNLAVPIRPIEEGEQGNEPIWLTHHVELSLGPLAP